VLLIFLLRYYAYSDLNIIEVEIADIFIKYKLFYDFLADPQSLLAFLTEFGFLLVNIDEHTALSGELAGI
jgi:hypothetical protein